jgi:heterodisulfide reductase subunit D
MDEYKIILFCCNWGPHAAYLNLQDRRAEIPDEIKMVRIPCSGRITKALLFKAFEMGADGVILLGCASGSCRYGSGTALGLKNTDQTREIISILGLGERRIRLESFLPDQSDELLAFLKGFVAGIKELGKSPIETSGKLWEEGSEPKTTSEILSNHDVYSCQDCGKCTSACPLALAGKPFSPRAIANDIIADRADTEEVRDSVNACLTCGVCYERCPSAVNFPEFIKDMRGYYKRQNLAKEPAHGGFFQSIMRSMTSIGLKPRRWNNLSEKLRTKKGNPVLFFGGCAPYFDIFFRQYLKIHTNNILEDSIRLLNFFDIEPAIMEEERCCGHDLLWSGDRDNFIKLARLNFEAIKESGAQELITSCPECYHTLSTGYKQFGIELPLKVTHIHEFLEREIENGAVGFKPLGKKVTYQDACRQSRFNNLAELPRKLMEKFAAGNIDEASSRYISTCCGNSAWTGCDGFSKAMQVQRLKQARSSGSELMVTACPKCQIHLRCAMEDALRKDDLQMDMMDITSAIAKTIYWK